MSRCQNSGRGAIVLGVFGCGGGLPRGSLTGWRKKNDAMGHGKAWADDDREVEG